MSTSRLRLNALMAVIHLMMLVYGISLTMLGPLVTVFIERFNISLSDNGLITFFQGIGGIICVFAGIFFADRFKKSAIINASFAVYCASLIALFFTDSYFLLLVLFFSIGGSTRILEAIFNAYITDIQKEKRRFHLSMLHVFLGIGALAGPMLSTLFIDSDIRINNLFLYLGILCVILLSAFVIVHKGVKENGNRINKKSVSVSNVLFKNKALVFFLPSFLYVGYAIASSIWMPAYMTRELRADAFLSGFSVSSLWIGVIAGRLLCSFLFAKQNVKYFILLCGISGGVIITIAVIINTPAAYIIGYILSGMTVGPAVPLTVMIAGDIFPDNTGSTSAIIGLGATTGVMVIPWLIGLIAQNAQFWTAILVLNLIPFLIGASALILPNKRYVKNI